MHMTIKEIETLSGLPRANIRYYESEGLIAPKRAENGYREYSQADAEVLLRVKLLRALGLRIDTIKSLAAGTLMLGDALDARLEELHAEQENLDAAGRVAAGLRQAHAEFSTLDAAGYLGELLAASQTALRQDVKPYVHAPVRRHIARSFDLLLCLLPWYLVLQAAGVDPKARLTSIWLSILGMVTMLVLEPLLLHLFGTTPGKWLMGLRVTDENGQRLPLAAAWRLSAVTWRFLPSPTRSVASTSRWRVGRSPAPTSQRAPRTARTSSTVADDAVSVTRKFPWLLQVGMDI